MTSLHHPSSSSSIVRQEEEMMHLIHQMSILQRRQSIRATGNSSFCPSLHHDNDSSDSTFASVDGYNDDDDDHEWCLQNSTDDDNDIIEDPSSSSSTLNLSFAYVSPVRSLRSSISTNDLTSSGGSLSVRRRRRRVVSFDSVTYIREYQRWVTSSNESSSSIGSASLGNGKCLLQLSWEHTPTIIGCLHDNGDDRHQQRCQNQPQRTNNNRKNKKPFRRLSYQERRARMRDVIKDLDDIHHNDINMIRNTRKDFIWQHDDDDTPPINPPVRISGYEENECHHRTKSSSQLHNAKMPPKRTNSLLSLPPRLLAKPDHSLAA